MKIALITGASSGLGREFVRQIAAGYPQLDEIWVVARSKSELLRLRRRLTVKIRIFAADLTAPETCRELKRVLATERPVIKLLVNAAGVGYNGGFAELSQSDHREMIQLNCQALTDVTYLALPYLRRGSRILQIASAAAFLPQPDFSVYAATKAYVVSFSRALRAELKAPGIAVTVVCPGPVDTPFLSKAARYRQSSSLKHRFAVSPSRVVAQALKDAAAARQWSICGLSMKAIQIGSKVLPQGLLIGLNEYLKHLESNRRQPLKGTR